MKNRIKEICKQLEEEHNIKIIFCCEAGSRVWGMESKNSDYDIRFVFIRPKNEYLKLNKLKEVIDELEVGSSKGCVEYVGVKCIIADTSLDFVGFDIYKFCSLLSKSNPAVIEWLSSDIIYYGKIPGALLAYAEAFHNRKSLFYHYSSMCKSNYLKYLKSKKGVTYKKYLYCMRGLINSKFVEFFPTILPPIKLEDTIWELERKSKEVPKNIIKDLKKLIKLKKRGKEKTSIKNIVRIDSYIESFLKTNEYKGEINNNVPNIKLLNQYILNKITKKS